MRDFVIVKKTDTTKKATLRVDIVSDEFEKFTIMYLDGVKGTDFEALLPWHQGSVISHTEIEQWAKENNTDYSIYEYGGEQIVLVGAETHDIKITPTITGGNGKVTVKMTGTYEGMPEISDLIDLENNVVKTVKGIDGYKYTFAVVTENAAWTSSAPEAVTVDGDKDVAIGITITEE